jgi:hypothetical protein
MVDRKENYSLRSTKGAFSHLFFLYSFLTLVFTGFSLSVVNFRLCSTANSFSESRINAQNGIFFSLIVVAFFLACSPIVVPVLQHKQQLHGYSYRK